MLFGHCSSGVVLDYFVHIPSSLFSIIVQLLRFTIPIFFSSLLYCLFHSMLLVMCGGGGGGRHVPHWEPTTRKPVIYRSSTVGGLFVRFSSAIVYRA
jgi:hypothetical protein